MIRNDKRFLPVLLAALLGAGSVCEAKLFRGKNVVQPGIDVLAGAEFEVLKGKRVGLVTNQSGVDAGGRKTRLVLHGAKEVNLVALYTPEHGLDGTEKAGVYVKSRRDKATGVMAYSLYGKTRKPSPDMLSGIDVLVFDIQDVGARCYTYVSTMGLCMEAAGEQGKEFVVLDRPNPLGGERVEGPLIEKKWMSFVGQYAVPFVHGLTAGELAKMINGERWMKAQPKLTVVPMRGWKRAMIWDDTGLAWVRTSPNIPRSDSSAYYIATGILQHLPTTDAGTGTSLPFEYIAAKGVDAKAFARRMNSYAWKGVRFEPYQSKKKSGWAGARLDLDPRTPENLAAMDLAMIAELNRAAGGGLFSGSLNLFNKIYGSAGLGERLKKGESPGKIAASWEGGVRAFRGKRKSYLIY